MFVFLHILCCLAAGFIAGWAVSINELRFKDQEFDTIWVYLLIMSLLAIAFGVATLNV